MRTVSNGKGDGTGCRTSPVRGIFGFAALLALHITVAGPAHPLTIEEALALAGQTSPIVQAAYESARARQEEVRFAGSAWRPSLSVSGSFAWDESGPCSFLDPACPDGEAGLAITQNLFRNGRDSAEFRRAEAAARQGWLETETTRQSVLLRTATAYLDVIRAERVVELRETALTAFVERIRETEAEFKVGDRTRADLAQARAERQIAAADVTTARAELADQWALFEELVGILPDGLEPAAEPVGLPETLEKARRMAEEERPAIRAAAYALQAAEHAVVSIAAEQGPSVDLRLGVGRSDFHGSEADGVDKQAILQVTAPFYQGGRVGARRQQAERVRAQRRAEWVALRREAARLATSAWRRLGAARQRREALVVAVEASSTALEGIRSEAEIGERTTREVLDAERTLVFHQVNALSAERDVVIYAYALLEAMGALVVEGDGSQDSDVRDAGWTPD